MIFTHKHYVPVLKVKRGEKRAIQLLSPAIRKQIAPLLEIVEIAKDKTLDKHLDTAFKGLEDVVGHFPRYFLDAREIESSGTEVLRRCLIAPTSSRSHSHR
jgi:hypothetical protein